MSDASVTRWIQGLRGGDEEAAARIWERFFARVQALARRRLGDAPRAAHDAEDVALSALHALCAGARADRFRSLEDRGDLWGVLATITVRKAIDARRRTQRVTEALAWSDVVAFGWTDSDGPDGAAAVTPDGEAYFDVLCLTSRELLDGLDPKLREVALLRLEGYSNDEIAARTGRSRPTVDRHLRMIRHSWQTEQP